MFCPRFQESLSSYSVGNCFRKIGRILRGLSKHPDGQNQVHFELKMKPQVGMRVTPELGWDFQAISSPQHPCSHFVCTKGALTLAAEMAPGRGCTCHAPHHSFDPGMFHWWGREFPVQQRTGSFLTTAHHSTRFAGNITSWADTSGFLSLCFNHLWLLNNNKDSLSTCFKQDAKRKKKKKKINS